MEMATNLISSLLAASPVILSLIVGLAAICLAAFAVYVVHATTKSREPR